MTGNFFSAVAASYVYIFRIHWKKWNIYIIYQRNGVSLHKFVFHKKVLICNVPCTGAKTFKYKQSSDWFCRNGNSRFKYSSRPLGIFSKAAVSFMMFGNRCGHTGLNLSDVRMPSHGDGARVGLNLWKESNMVLRYIILSLNLDIVSKILSKTQTIFFRFIYIYIFRTMYNSHSKQKDCYILSISVKLSI